ncbi:four helix bundle protein [Rubrivirga sp.]|uniref:four helix bundle protein n=1 Tax=Rubrivirga sp. TaxID=1885344 RepID=UPI003C73A5D1
MAGFKRFEDIEAWQIARELNLEVYRATRSGAFSRDFGLRDQIRRASISVSSNIAEGFARRTPKDFARFLTIARASAAEVCSQLYLALDLEYVAHDDFDRLYRLAQRAGGSCGGLIRYLRSSGPAAVREPEEVWTLEDVNPEPGTPNL